MMWGFRGRARRQLLQLYSPCRCYVQGQDLGPPPKAGSGGHCTGFEIEILGSSSKAPTLTSSCPSTGVRMSGQQWLFDCGEGTQRQLLTSSVMRTGALVGICITHLHGDHVLGLPGVLLSSMNRDPGCPLPHVYGPEGLYNFVSMAFKLCEAKVGHIPLHSIVVHELMEKRGEGERDQRPAYHRKMPEFKVAHLDYKAIPRDPDGYWTIESNANMSIRAGKIAHTISTFGYVVTERDQRGKIDSAKTTALGLRPGPTYKRLVNGEDVRLPDGTVIRSADVTSPGRRGRKVTILGDTCDPYAIAPLAHGSDVLVHEATLESAMEMVAVSRGHSTPIMAAKFAKYIDAGHLVLNHFSNRYSCSPASAAAPDNGQTLLASDEQVRLTEEAESIMGEGNVTPARDFLVLPVPWPKTTTATVIPAADATTTTKRYQQSRGSSEQRTKSTSSIAPNSSGDLASSSSAAGSSVVSTRPSSTQSPSSSSEGSPSQAVCAL